jgi:putative peptidoglycan lipid II flippase
LLGINGLSILQMRLFFSKIFQAATGPILVKAMGLMAASSLMRGLGALAAVVLAADQGTGPGMDRYMAYVVVVTTVCALLSASFPTLVARQLLQQSKEEPGAPAQQCRAWARKVGRFGLLGYALLTPVLTLMLAPSEARLELWTLLAIGAPCVYVCARTAVEHALLHAQGRAYTGLWCSGLFSASSFLAAVVSLQFGGLYACAIGASVGAVLEYKVSRRLVLSRERVSSPGSTLTDVEAGPKLSHPLPWPAILALVGASAGALLSGLFDQTLLSKMGPGVQAVYGLASRVPSFLAVTAYAAGSVLLALVLSQRSALTRREFHIRVGELLGLMLVLSTLFSGLVWAYAQPIIQVLFERGSFDARDTQRVAQAMPYAVLAYFAFPASAVLLRAVSLEAKIRTLLASSCVFFVV